MIPVTTIIDWGQRMAAVVGIATPIYGGLAYYKLTPVTEGYVTAQINSVQKGIAASRVDVLDTKRTVMGLARNDLVREMQALELAAKTETNPNTAATFSRRIETIKADLENLDKRVLRLDEKIEGMKQNE